MGDPPLFSDASTMRNFSRNKRAQGHRIALVPTMVRIKIPFVSVTACVIPGFRQIFTCCAMYVQGYLHEGHLSLIKAARFGLLSCSVIAVE